MSPIEAPHTKRDAILDAAETAFAERGFHETKLRDVAAQVGVTQPLIHHYFGSKDELFRAVVVRVLAAYEKAQSAQWSREPNDVRFFTEGLSALSTFIGEHRASARLFAWARLERRTPDVRAAAELDAKIRQKFVAAQKAGVLRPDFDVDVLRLMIDGAIRGFWDRADDMPLLRERASQMSQALIEAMLPALLTDAALTEARALLAKRS